MLWKRTATFPGRKSRATLDRLTSEMRATLLHRRQLWRRRGRWQKGSRETLLAAWKQTAARQWQCCLPLQYTRRRLRCCWPPTSSALHEPPLRGSVWRPNALEATLLLQSLGIRLLSGTLLLPLPKRAPSCRCNTRLQTERGFGCMPTFIWCVGGGGGGGEGGLDLVQ